MNSSTSTTGRRGVAPSTVTIRHGGGPGHPDEVISGLGVGSVANVTTGTGTFTVNGNTTLSAQGSTFGNINSVTISGTLALQVSGGAAATRTFTINESTSP